MRISELIKELERVKSEKGDLLVSVYSTWPKSNYNFYNEVKYCKDINLEVVNNTNTNLKNAIGETIIVNEAYFLGIL